MNFPIFQYCQIWVWSWSGRGKQQKKWKELEEDLEMGMEWEQSPGRWMPKSTLALLHSWRGASPQAFPPPCDLAPSCCFLVDQGSCSVFPPGHPSVGLGQDPIATLNTWVFCLLHFFIFIYWLQPIPEQGSDVAEVFRCDSRVLKGELWVLGSSSNLVINQATMSWKLDFLFCKMGISIFPSPRKDRMCKIHGQVLIKGKACIM